ncbi:uroporphyrinogen-III synthase [Sandaracinobacteroides saxicola]|uniref:Uroporphyrinogen-III synthase n=1 Tax=Sandaracinobacteroides saxicola TaxID=2759707 RepID=A0A7G5IL90_9SPHN|nr:uroporphyrinogen-III synthase [Sandaracinobacteroides saxicola]QMW24132.1 uroporphyrinogen-III synthase [Sandaracinobacteroides saxicola]
MTALLITRPQPEADLTARAARTAGFTPIVAPLLLPEPVPWTLPADPFDALLLTSPQAPALAGAALPLAAPAWCVGARTAQAARAAGLTHLVTGDSNGAALLARAAAAGLTTLLHLAGEDRTPLAPPPGLTLLIRTVYRARAVTALPKAALAHLTGPAPLVALFSARTATLFATLAHALPRARIALATLSPAIAAAAGPGWRAVAIAARPTTESLLAAARTLCDNPPHDRP